MSTMKLSQPEQLFLKDNEELIRQNKFQEFFDQVENYRCKNKFFHFFYNYGINPLKYMESIPSMMFYRDKEIFDFVIPENIQSIGAYAFSESSVKNVTLPKSLQIIWNNAFESCEQLESIDIPKSTTLIGHQAFEDCDNLKWVRFNCFPRLFGAYIFIRCGALEKIYVDSCGQQNVAEQFARGILEKQELEKEPEIIFESLQNNSQRLVEKIVKIGNKWQVQSEKGRNMGTYNTKKEAEKRLKQVEYFKHINESNLPGQTSLREVLEYAAQRLCPEYDPNEEYCVHHLNNIHTDNSLGNVALMKVNRHRSYHNRLTRLNNNPNYQGFNKSDFDKDIIEVGKVILNAVRLNGYETPESTDIHEAVDSYFNRDKEILSIAQEKTNHGEVNATAYHGSQSDNIKFRDDYPLYLTDDKELAIDFAKGYNFNYELLDGETPTVYSFRIKMKNPLYIHTEDEYENYMLDTNWDTELVQDIIDNGYDGMVYEEEGHPTYYMLFNPKEQAKIIDREIL